MDLTAERRDRLRIHLAIIDRDIEPVVSRYRAHIQCRSGCSECCRQTFRVSELEGALLYQGLSGLVPAVRDDILARARAYRPNSATACPVLSDGGLCRLYEHRPRICRKYGIPLWDAERPHEVRTCALNFRGVEDIDPTLILEPQANWARDWIVLREQLGLATQSSRTIAEWLVADDDESR